jgi:hypothetical protein
MEQAQTFSLEQEWVHGDCSCCSGSAESDAMPGILRSENNPSFEEGVQEVQYSEIISNMTGQLSSHFSGWGATCWTLHDLGSN